MNVQKKSSTAHSAARAVGVPTDDTDRRVGPLTATQRRVRTGRALLTVAATVVSSALWAQGVPMGGDTPRYPAATSSPTPAGRTQAASEVFTDNAPDTYTVVRGDTLWGIAGRFLKQPWRWPEIWQINRAEIRNPHWIYPGQVIVLDRATGTMRLRGGPDGNGTVKLSPQVRVETSRDAIPSIPPEVIAPYLTQPLVVETQQMLDAPRIVSARESRVVIGAGDTAYVSGITDPSITNYQVFRPGRPLRDPDTNEIIAYQADYLGTALVTKAGSPATVRITSSKMEMNAGDRLVATSKPVVVNYMPHAPTGELRGRIVSTYAGLAYAGTDMIVAINRGASDGVDIGTVLAIKSFGRSFVDRTNGTPEAVVLPEERKGLLFIFRTFDHISYGLITSSNAPVEIGDAIAQP